MKLKTFLLLVLVTGLAAWGAYTTFKSQPKLPKAGEVVFPGLLESVNAVRTIAIQSDGESFEVSAGDGRWQIPSRSAYRADAEKVRQLLLGLGELVYVEPKTSNKSLYERLGLDDPSKAKSTSVRIALTNDDGKTPATLTVGNRKPARGTPGDEEFFVLTAQQDQAWLVRGKLPFAMSTVLDWLDREIVKVDSDRTLSVTVKHPDGYQLEVFKVKPADANFTIRGLEESEKIDDIWRVNDIGRLFLSMELDDVLPAAEAPDPTQPYLVLMKTFDGMVVNARIWKQGERVLAEFDVSYDASLRDSLSAATSEPGSDSGDQQNSKNALPAALLDAEATQKEVARITQRLKGWTYEIPDFKLDYIKRRKSDLLVKPEPDKSDGTSAAPDSTQGAQDSDTGATATGDAAASEPDKAPAGTGDAGGG